MKKDIKPEERKQACPYCDEEITQSRLPFCKPCGITFRYCQACKVTVLDKQATKCPKCGKELS